MASIESFTIAFVDWLESVDFHCINRHKERCGGRNGSHRSDCPIYHVRSSRDRTLKQRIYDAEREVNWKSIVASGLRLIPHIPCNCTRNGKHEEGCDMMVAVIFEHDAYIEFGITRQFNARKRNLI